MLRIAVLMTLLLTTWSMAQEHVQTLPTTGAAAYAALQPHPALSADSSWAGVMIIIVLGMFLAAAVIGPVVIANAPEEIPQPDSHDSHGGSDHHGAAASSDHGHGHGH